MSTGVNPHVGSTFDDFLAEQGILEEVSAEAKSRVHRAVLEEASRLVDMNPAPSTPEDERLKALCELLQRLEQPNDVTLSSVHQSHTGPIESAVSVDELFDSTKD